MRKINGGPSNAQNMIVTRPFSFRWAAVSLPLPVASRYPTRFGLKMRKVSMPFGERLTRPPLAGAEATKKIFCRVTNSLWLVVSSGKNFAMEEILDLGQLRNRWDGTEDVA